MYKFHYFSQTHFINLFFCIFLGIFILLGPRFFKVNKLRYATFLGWSFLSVKLFETFYRELFENFSLAESAPLHFCNFAIIICSFYLITRKNVLFNISYFFSFGAFFALVLPGVNYYNHNLFFTLFMVDHTFVLISVLYGFIWLHERPDAKGLKVSIITVLLLFLFSYFYNNIFGTNFMFLKDYIAPFFSFIKPFSLYIAILIPAFILIMYLMYLPFRTNKNHKNRKLNI